MPQPKLKLRSIGLAALCLLALGGAAAFAQRHFAIAAAPRPEVKVFLAAAVERENGPVPVEKAQLVKKDETLNWTISSENIGGAAALDYKTVSRIPAGTTFVAGSAKADASAKVAYSIDGGKSFAATPVVEEKQAGKKKRK